MVTTTAQAQTGVEKLTENIRKVLIVLADEINRSTPKTQSALLEAMNELQVSIDGQTYMLDRPFMVIATENPVEYHGTFPLPEAQLDRFLLLSLFLI